MKAVVFGYQEIGSVCLEELLAFGVQVSCLFTHEDDPREEIWFRRPVAIAKKHDIPVYTPETLKDEKWIKLIKEAAPDFIFSFYYRNMIPKGILDIARIAALNLHGSLLPKFRGRAPVNWVLVNGESETGITLHEMVEKPDAGDIVAQKKVEIAFDDDVYTLYMKMTEAARQLMKETLPKLAGGSFVKIPQTGVSSYFGGRKPEDGLISWQRMQLPSIILSGPLLIHIPEHLPVWVEKNCLSGRPFPRMIAAIHNRERLFRCIRSWSARVKGY